MRTRTWGLLILLGGVLFAHGPAWGAACVDGTTVNQFIAFGATGCDNGDKRYSRDTSPGTTASLGTSLLSWDISGSINSIALDFQDGIATTPGTYTFDYNITILNPLNVFAAVSLDSNCSTILIPNSCIVSKQEQSGPKFTTLVSNNGGSSSTTIPGGQTTLSVLDTITIGASGNLISISNAYTQQLASPVPEPSTFIMLGIGLASLGVLRLRRRSR